MKLALYLFALMALAVFTSASVTVTQSKLVKVSFYDPNAPSLTIDEWVQTWKEFQEECPAAVSITHSYSKYHKDMYAIHVTIDKELDILDCETALRMSFLVYPTVHSSCFDHCGHSSCQCLPTQPCGNGSDGNECYYTSQCTDGVCQPRTSLDVHEIQIKLSRDHQNSLDIQTFNRVVDVPFFARMFFLDQLLRSTSCGIPPSNEKYNTGTTRLTSRKDVQIAASLPDCTNEILESVLDAVNNQDVEEYPDKDLYPSPKEFVNDPLTITSIAITRTHTNYPLTCVKNNFLLCYGEGEGCDMLCGGGKDCKTSESSKYCTKFQKCTDFGHDEVVCPDIFLANTALGASIPWMASLIVIATILVSVGAL